MKIYCTDDNFSSLKDKIKKYGMNIKKTGFKKELSFKFIFYEDEYDKAYLNFTNKRFNIFFDFINKLEKNNNIIEKSQLNMDGINIATYREFILVYLVKTNILYFAKLDKKRLRAVFTNRGEKLKKLLQYIL